MSKRVTTEVFIINARKVHGDKYDYSLTQYYRAIVPIVIVCPIHGEFRQKPNVHLNGSSCYRCGVETSAAARRKSKEVFIKQSNIIHNYLYDYSKVAYINTDTDVIIKCSAHGDFTQRPDHHLKGSGCPRCSGVGPYTQEDFIRIATQTHHGKYDYSISVYKNGDTPIAYMCPRHGIIWQNASKHMNGNGCESCKESRGEKRIANFLEDNNILYCRSKRFDGCRHKYRLPFDFYLPEYNLCIEFDGEHHFYPIEHFGGEKHLCDTQLRDKIKDNYCKDNKIGLVRIKYNEDLDYYLNLLL